MGPNVSRAVLLLSQMVEKKPAKALFAVNVVIALSTNTRQISFFVHYLY
jgi:hypothetical protein